MLKYLMDAMKVVRHHNSRRSQSADFCSLIHKGLSFIPHPANMTQQAMDAWVSTAKERFT